MATEDDADLTVPQEGSPRPVPARRVEAEDGEKGGGQDTYVEGASDGEFDSEPTFVEGADSTLVQASGTAPEKTRGPAQETPRVFADRFEVERVLGEGGMGRVYVVRDRQIEGRRIALKVLRPRFSRNERFREMFFKEIRAAQSFVSPHVTQVRDTGQMKDGTLFLTMDLVDGEPLDRVLEREGSLLARHALEITRQVLLGLASGHEQGFVHCDVKPSNVILAAKVPKTEDNPFGVGVRVLDFGISSLAAEMEEGTAVGTPRYMSPEQVQGQRLDARSDLFATGVLLYEMLSGARPFEGTTPQEVQTAVLETDVTPLIRDLEELPEPVRKILAKALEKDRQRRFQSADEFIAAIEKSSSYKEPRGVPRWVAPVLALFVVVAVAEAAMLWRQRERIDGLLGEKAELAGARAAEVRREVDLALADQARTHQIALNGRDKTIAGLEQAVLSLQAELDQINTTDQLTAGDLAVRLEDAKRRYEEEKEARVKLEEQVEELRAWRERTETHLTPQYQAASHFDDLLQRIESGYPGSALRRLRSLAEKGTLAIAGDQGGELVADLVGAAADLEQASPLLDPEELKDDPTRRAAALAALDRGRKRLLRVEESAGAFALEAGQWLSTPLEQNPEPDRLARIDALRERLRTTLAELEQHEHALANEEARSRDEELERILASPLDAEPARVVAHLETYGAEPLDARLVYLGAWAERTYAPEGRLDLQALARSEVVDVYGAWAVGNGAAVRNAGLDTIRWLYAAQLWYAGEDLPPALERLLEPPPSLRSSTPYADWRAALSLAVALHGSRFYPAVDGEAVLRTRWKGVLQWHRVTVESRDGEGWTMKRRGVTGDGRLMSHVEELTVERKGDRLRVDREVILDLRAGGAGVSVANWPHELHERLPAASWSDGLDDEAFAAAIEGDVPCLVYRKANQEYWYSPTLGLVRQVRGEDFVRELVYSDAIR